MQAAEGEFALVTEGLLAAMTNRSTWIGEHDIYANLADNAAQQRDIEALHQYAPRAEESANRVGHMLYQGIAHRAWGVLHRLTGEYQASESRLNQALDLFRGLNTRWQLGRTLFELGELAVACNDSTAARERFRLALSAFQAIRAARNAASVQTALELLK